MREVESPKAPSSMACATAASMARSSSGVAARLSFPMTRFRTPPAPTKVPRLIVEPRRRNSAKYCASVVQLGVTP